MKNLFSLFFIITLSMFVTACSSNSPRNTAEKALDCSIKGDYQGLVDCYYAQEKDENKKEALVQLLEAKAGKNLKDSEIIESYRFIKEEIDEDNGKAKVTFDVQHKDGSSEEIVLKMFLADDGKWYINPKQ